LFGLKNRLFKGAVFSFVHVDENNPNKGYIAASKPNLMNPIFTKANSLKTLFVSILIICGLQSHAQCDEYFATLNVQIAVTCPGGSDGTLGVDVFNGAAPYQYLWSTGETTASISGIPAGAYSVNVIDANQCITVAVGLMTQPQPFDFNIVSSNSGCNATTGELLVSATGGTGNLQYSLDGQNWQAGNFNLLDIGLYTVYVIDELGCEGLTYSTISVISGPEVSAAQMVSNNCFEDCNAAISAFASNGMPPYFYSWFTIDEQGEAVALDVFTSDVSQLCEGYYFSVVTDESGVGGGGDTEVFWSENFGVGCNTGQLANGFVSTNGTWTTTSTGTNAVSANTFFISATEQIDAGGCGLGCGGNNSRTLHLGNVAIAGIVAADGGATYNAGGACAFGICVTTNLRAESPVINCTGRTSIELGFDYIEFGQGTLDNATLWYFDGSVWSMLVDLPKTTCCGGPCNGTNQGSFTAYSITLPASADNNPNVKIGFNWTNNDDGVGTDPSFAVDNITVTGTGIGGGGSCPAYSPVVYIGQPAPMHLFVVKFGEISCNGADDGAIEVQVAGGQTPYSYLWSNGVEFSANLDLEPGEYTVVVTDVNDCEIEQTFIIAPEPAAETVGFEVFALDLDVLFINNSSAGNYWWDFGDGNSSDEFEPLYTYESSGLYEVCLTLVSPCGDQSTCQEINIVSTGIESQSADISIFPNPFSSQLILNFEQLGFFEFMVYSVHGKLIQSEMVTTSRFELNTENWNTGLYLIQVLDRNTGKTFTHRVVKSIR
jgi:hypothetical protein